MKSNLFQLIQSLTPSERRYFRVKHASGGEKAYMRVFEWMESLEGYEDQMAMEEFAGEKFLGQFGVLKNYLQEVILESLRTFHKDHFPILKLRDRLGFVQVLFHRGMMELSLKETRKVKKVAEAAGELNLLIESLKWEVRLVRLQKGGEEQVAQIRKEIIHCAELEMREAEVSELYDDVFGLMLRRLHVAEDTIREEVEKIYQAAVILEELELGLHSQVILGHVFAYVNLILQNSEALNQRYGKVVKLVESKSHYAKFRPDLVLNVYRGYLESCFQLNNFKETSRVIELIQKVSVHSFAEKARQESLCLMLWIFHAISQEDFSAAIDLEPRIDTLFQRFQEVIPATYEITILHNLSLALLMSGKLILCRRWLNRILNQPQSSHRKDIREFARLLNLIVLLELEEVETLESEIRNSARFLARNQQLTLFETELLTFLKASLNTVGDKAQKGLKEDFLKKLTSLKAELDHHVGYSAMITWLKLSRN